MDLSNVLETVREDDFVEYYLFPNMDLEDPGVLNNCLIQINNTVELYACNYLWHKDKFNIEPRIRNYQILDSDDASNAKENILSHLYGVVHFGDNIEDEWFLVSLLLHLTRRIDGLIVRVLDSDGEFLLIEAANHLPQWANPETCEKRVYLYQGQLHLIPFTEQSTPSIKDALLLIRERSLLTEASSHIQESIRNRTKGYPEKIQEFQHHATVYVPIGVAAILKYEPNLIAAAVLAFCDRDPIDMKLCKAMKYYPPETRVYTRVKFTKCLYAMLNRSKFTPDKRTGWNLPGLSSDLYKSHNLGVRIACGFEILVAQIKPELALENDKTWNKYLESLKRKNYFRDLLEHSEEYNYLLTKAKNYFKKHNLNAHSFPILGQYIYELNQTLDSNPDDFKTELNLLPEDDDESWLNLTPNDLDEMLTERYGTNYQRTNTGNLTAKLNEFLNHVSDLDGAEFPNEIETGTDSQSNAENNNDSEEQSKVNFDPATFSCAIQNMLDLVIPDDSWDLESGSELSEYGDEANLNMEDNLDPTKIREYMSEMDRELATTTIGQSFDLEKKTVPDDSFDDIETFQPVDIDMTALKNILESYQSEMGEAGPASNMLGPMGIHLDPKSSENNKE